MMLFSLSAALVVYAYPDFAEVSVSFSISSDKLTAAYLRTVGVSVYKCFGHQTRSILQNLLGQA